MRLGVLLADQPEREFGAGLRRQHRLRSLAGIAADDAVDVAGRARPDHLQHRYGPARPPGPRGRRRRETCLVEIEAAPLLRDVLGQFRNAVVETGQRDAAVVVVQVGDDVRENVDRVDRRRRRKCPNADRGSAPWMTTSSSTRPRSMVVIAGVVAVPHAGVADEQRDRPSSSLLVGGEEGGQRGRAGFLLAFEQNGDVAGQAADSRKARQASTKVMSWPLSSAAPRADDCVGRSAPRRGAARTAALPEIERIGRLHVVMAIEQHMRRVGARRLGMRDDHRMARGRPRPKPRSRAPCSSRPASRRRGRNRASRRDRWRWRESATGRTGGRGRPGGRRRALQAHYREWT